MAENVSAHVVISGKVQGVFYRAETQKAARQRGVTGWVRNRADGTVEAVFEGGENDVASMIEWCKSGSPAAKVDNVDVDWETYTGDFSAFEVTY